MAVVNTLKDTAQNFTASWVDYGGEIGTDGHTHLSVWLNIDINDTVNARVRLLVKHTKDGAEYTLPINTTTESVVTIKPEYCEFSDDADQKMAISFHLDFVIPFVQIQIQAGTVGGTAGQILDSKYIIT